MKERAESGATVFARGTEYYSIQYCQVRARGCTAYVIVEPIIIPSYISQQLLTIPSARTAIPTARIMMAICASATLRRS